MTRWILSAFLLSLSCIATAQVVTPNHASDNGANPGCPEAPAAESAPPDVGRHDDVPPPAGALSETVQVKTAPVASTPSVRPKNPMRWHSFLPGMMK